jgi:HPt (histidine-containing phosphotransfer) domain-containing protein
MMTTPTIDRPTFDTLEQTTGAEFARELVGTFLQEAPTMLDDLRDAVAKGDAERFRRAAHSLKSNSNTFGALQLGAMARELELGGIAKATANDGAFLTTLNSEYSRVAAALDELRHA